MRHILIILAMFIIWRQCSASTFDFIKQFEDLRYDIYFVDNKPHICLGHLLSNMEYRKRIIILGNEHKSILKKVDQEFCRKVFVYDLKRIDKIINDHVTYSLNDNQLKAVRSYVYNTGYNAFFNKKDGRIRFDQPNKFLKALNSGNIEQAVKHINIITASGKVFKGLKERRIKEQELFATNWSEEWNSIFEVY